MMIRCAAGAEGARCAQRAWRISLHLIRFSPCNLITKLIRAAERVFGPAWRAFPIAHVPKTLKNFQSFLNFHFVKTGSKLVRVRSNTSELAYKGSRRRCGCRRGARPGSTWMRTWVLCFGCDRSRTKDPCGGLHPGSSLTPPVFAFLLAGEMAFPARFRGQRSTIGP